MTQQTEGEKLLQSQIERLVRLHPDIFPTEAAVWTRLRGDLRRGIWEKSSAKFQFKNKACTPPPKGYTGRARLGAECALTGEWTGKSKMEVDHKKGNVSLRKPEDVVPFIAHLLSSGDQLQLVSKEAHKVKSYAERYGMDFEEAKATKEVIAMEKRKGEVESFLKGEGIKPARTKKARREQAVKVLTGLNQ